MVPERRRSGTGSSVRVSERWIVLDRMSFTICLAILYPEVPGHQADKQNEQELSSDRACMSSVCL